MNIELENYIKDVISFFDKNPNSLQSLVPVNMKNEFYSLIRKTAEINFEMGGDVVLTREQLLEVCKEINSRWNSNNSMSNSNIFFKTGKWGEICLN